MKETLVVFLLNVEDNVQYSIQVRTKLLPLRYSIVHLFSALDIIEEIGMIKSTPRKTGSRYEKNQADLCKKPLWYV
jgi:hypothetical protein